MTDGLTEKVREYLSAREGQQIDIRTLRADLLIEPGSENWDNLFTIISRYASEKRLRYVAKGTGVYQVISPILPVKVFGVERERLPPFDLRFPRDYNTMMEMGFAESVVIRAGDIITIGGVKSQGKTTLCLNFAGENIDQHPILMGNEYTNAEHEPTARFLNRLDTMDANKDGWISWVDVDGNDKFTLYPVRENYADYIIRDRINIIDWVNLAGDRSYDIGRILEGIKFNLGMGVGIIALQKGEGKLDPRGAQYVRDFSDLEILLDSFGEKDGDVLLTIRGAKEKRSPIVGKTYAYSIIGDGVKIVEFREVKKCPACHNTGFTKSGKCETCFGNKFVDK